MIPHPEQLLIEAEKRSAVQLVIAMLHPRAQHVIRLYYGFDSDPQTLEQIAKPMHVSTERVRQMHRHSLRKLRSRKAVLLLRHAGWHIASKERQQTAREMAEEFVEQQRQRRRAAEEWSARWQAWYAQWESEQHTRAAVN
jgi:hypothetical protein